GTPQYQPEEDEELRRQKKEAIKNEIIAFYRRTDFSRTKTFNITDFLGPNALERGVVLKSFPLPNEKIWGAYQSMQVGTSLAQVQYQIDMQSAEDITMTITGYKEDAEGNEYENARSTWQWLKKEGKFRYVSEADQLSELIQKHDLVESIASIEDPNVLLSYIMLSSPNLPLEIAQSLVTRSFRGLRSGIETPDKLKEYHLYRETDHDILLSDTVDHTGNNLIEVKGKVQGGYSAVQVTGDRTQVVQTDKDGNFHARFILRPASKTTLIFVGFDSEKHTRTRPKELTIHQTSPAQDTEDMFLALLTAKKDVRERIQQKPEQLRYMVRKIERSVLKYFTEDEAIGFAHLQKRIQSAPDELIKGIYESIDGKFKRVAELTIPGFRSTERQFFFQKYAHDWMRQKKKDSQCPGVILALEQGLGKTLILLSFSRGNEDGAMIIAPNAVVSIWGEQEGKFFEDNLLAIIRGTSLEKTQAIEAAGNDPKVANLEFLRNTSHNRFVAMNVNDGQDVIIDESQFIGRTGTLQTQGAHRLRGAFTVLSSATPYARPEQMRAVFDFLIKVKGMLKSRAAFERAFDKADPEALRMLHFLFDEYVLRIKKDDVFRLQEDPQSLQRNRLPNKHYVDSQELGEFTLTESQCHSIVQMFVFWDEWREKHLSTGRRTRDDELLQRGRGGDSFSKKHSLRQAMNSPGYTGGAEESPKHAAMDKIIEKEVKGNKAKVIIFTQYMQQVRDYYERYKQQGLGVLTLYSETALTEGLHVKRGYLTDHEGHIRYFRMKSKNEYAIGKDGRPVEVKGKEKGSPITPLDYNRLASQNDPTINIVITTYETGAFGLTLTARDVAVFDDLARDYSQQYQAEERINRIDNDRLKFANRYYFLRAKYPESFLEQTKRFSVIVHKRSGHREIIPTESITQQQRRNKDLEIRSLYRYYLAQGTYDEVHGKNLRAQEAAFNIMMEGFSDAEDTRLFGGQREKEAMPFLFEDNGQNNTGMTLASKDAEVDQTLSANIFTPEAVAAIGLVLTLAGIMIAHSFFKNRRNSAFEQSSAGKSNVFAANLPILDALGLTVIMSVIIGMIAWEVMKQYEKDSKDNQSDHVAASNAEKHLPEDSNASDETIQPFWSISRISEFLKRHQLLKAAGLAATAAFVVGLPVVVDAQTSTSNLSAYGEKINPDALKNTQVVDDNAMPYTSEEIADIAFAAANPADNTFIYPKIINDDLRLYINLSIASQIREYNFYNNSKPVIVVIDEQYHSTELAIAAFKRGFNLTEKLLEIYDTLLFSEEGAPYGEIFPDFLQDSTPSNPRVFRNFSEEQLLVLIIEGLSIPQSLKLAHPDRTIIDFGIDDTTLLAEMDDKIASRTVNTLLLELMRQDNIEDYFVKEVEESLARTIEEGNELIKRRSEIGISNFYKVADSLKLPVNIFIMGDLHTQDVVDYLRKEEIPYYLVLPDIHPKFDWKLEDIERLNKQAESLFPSQVSDPISSRQPTDDQFLATAIAGKDAAAPMLALTKAPVDTNPQRLE
ncbi:MAG: DEAD/DEAH box helicase, partial [Candidatus Omnitrophota bacterium]